MPPRILVLFNQPVLPPEHPDAHSEYDILDTAANTVRVLEAAGFAVRRLGISHDPRPLLDELRDHRPDAVFNLFEGLATQPATEVAVAGLLEWQNVAFTGSPSAALALGRDKVRTKHLLAAAGLPTADYRVIDQLPTPKWGRAWPAIVKPACQDASVGIDQASVVTTQRQLDQRVRYVLKTYGPPVLVERFVFGREFHVNLIEDGPAGARRPLTVLPLAEIGFEHAEPNLWPVYTYAAKWHTESDEYKATPLRSPVEIPAEAAERLGHLAAGAFRLLQCRDYARLDVRMTPEGEFYVLEVNPNPYLNSIALVNGLQAIGRTHERLIVDLARGAVARGGVRIRTGATRVPVGVSRPDGEVLTTE
jgi:D-alanine-D-alanine ligase